MCKEERKEIDKELDCLLAEAGKGFRKNMQDLNLTHQKTLSTINKEDAIMKNETRIENLFIKGEELVKTLLKESGVSVLDIANMNTKEFQLLKAGMSIYKELKSISLEMARKEDAKEKSLKEINHKLDLLLARKERK